jgi:hypothetical protein
MSDRWVISHTGKKGGPWEDAMTGRAGTPTQRLASAAFDARGELKTLLVSVRLRHPHAKVFRLVRRSKVNERSRLIAKSLLGVAMDLGLLDKAGIYARLAYIVHGINADLLPSDRVTMPGAPDDTSPEERAVVEAACVWEEADGSFVSNQDERETRAHRVVSAREACLAAVRALRAKRGG